MKLYTALNRLSGMRAAPRTMPRPRRRIRIVGLTMPGLPVAADVWAHLQWAF